MGMKMATFSTISAPLLLCVCVWPSLPAFFLIRAGTFFLSASRHSSLQLHRNQSPSTLWTSLPHHLLFRSVIIIILPHSSQLELGVKSVPPCVTVFISLPLDQSPLHLFWALPGRTNSTTTPPEIFSPPSSVLCCCSPGRSVRWSCCGRRNEGRCCGLEEP